MPKKLSNEEEEVGCPKDLVEWVNSDPMLLFYLYDCDLLPEQIHTKKEVCALRGFQFGWQCHILSVKEHA